jgi:thiosulfate dehydrogenase [quinone] large subunit
VSAISDCNNRAIAFLRIAVGILFIIFGEYKVCGVQFTLGGGFQFWIKKFIVEGSYPFMIPVLSKFVLPHSTLLAFLVAYGELAIGVALVLGILVRHASVAGLVYMITLLFSSDYPGGHAPLWKYFGASLSHSVFALCFLSFLLGKSEALWSYPAWRTSHLRARTPT